MSQLKTIVWVYVCTTLQGTMAILIHSILKILVLPKITASSSVLLPVTRGPLCSTPLHRHCVHRFVRTEELMSSLVICFGSPQYICNITVFVFPCRSYTFK